MKSSVILEINDEKVPLNQYLTKIFTKINIALAETLKGMEVEPIKSLKIKINLVDE
ncbi:MAG: hypothetical protein KAU62_07240 [Candidatus Heimdallarchaeota archaeon]|nr:hypothetical protein [Candidatus Heimdallarchaeota archaeon]MCG3255864.1 hypothetical protein [Candidatus Heimdallarchaeota archaeon]MCK4610935.1 hypothetical protein [Candidatus Heimdallarchaeota archaeon]